MAAVCALPLAACSSTVDPETALLAGCGEEGHPGNGADVVAGGPFTTMRFLAGGEDVIEPGDAAARDHPTVGVGANRAWYGVVELEDGVCVGLAYGVDLDGWEVDGGLVRVAAVDLPTGTDEPDDFRRDVEFAGASSPQALTEDGVDPDVPLVTAWADLPGCVTVSVSVDLRGPGGAVTTWSAHGRYGRECGRQAED